MTLLKAALQPTSAFLRAVQNGMDAFLDRDKALIAVSERRKIGDSLDLEEEGKWRHRGHLPQAIGVEITAPSAVPLDRVNRMLADLGESPLERARLPARSRGGSTDSFAI
jgi:hypothetical protein